MSDTTVIYLRVSKEDEFIKDESNSISNQRIMLMKYVNEHEELARTEIIEIKDDGYSGKNMQRPGRRLPGLLLSGRETPKNAPELVYRTQNTAQDFSCVQRLSYRASVSSGRFSNISQPARNAASGNMIA